jgi:hypothetical protein
VVEVKRTTLDLDLATPQILTYMMANPNPNRPTFGLITNGGSFLFLKLTQDTPQYDLSSVFSLLPLRNELYDVLRVLKQISELIIAA